MMISDDITMKVVQLIPVDQDIKTMVIELAPSPDRSNSVPENEAPSEPQNKASRLSEKREIAQPVSNQARKRLRTENVDTSNTSSENNTHAAQSHNEKGPAVTCSGGQRQGDRAEKDVEGVASCQEKEGRGDQLHLAANKSSINEAKNCDNNVDDEEEEEVSTKDDREETCDENVTPCDEGQKKAVTASPMCKISCDFMEIKTENVVNEDEEMADISIERCYSLTPTEVFSVEGPGKCVDVQSPGRDPSCQHLVLSPRKFVIPTRKHLGSPSVSRGSPRKDVTTLDKNLTPPGQNLFSPGKDSMSPPGKDLSPHLKDVTTFNEEPGTRLLDIPPGWSRLTHSGGKKKWYSFMSPMGRKFKCLNKAWEAHNLIMSETQTNENQPTGGDGDAKGSPDLEDNVDNLTDIVKMEQDSFVGNHAEIGDEFKSEYPVQHHFQAKLFEILGLPCRDDFQRKFYHTVEKDYILRNNKLKVVYYTGPNNIDDHRFSQQPFEQMSRRSEKNDTFNIDELLDGSEDQSSGQSLNKKKKKNKNKKKKKKN